MENKMTNFEDLIANLEHFYESTNSLTILKNFERVLDELDLYVFDNWITHIQYHR